MSLYDAINIASSGLTAQRLRLDIIANNIANANTTRTVQGGPYRRKVVIFMPRDEGGLTFPFVKVLENAQKEGNGVKVQGIVDDKSPFRYEYDPAHPDANAQGYVAYPNVNMFMEMVDMMTATRAYEANVAVISATKSMALKTLEIGR